MKIRLSSAPMIHAPGLWRWAVAMYPTNPKYFVRLMKAWDHPQWTAKTIRQALTGKLPVTVGDDYVEVTVK
jgi:hypothetical protein